MMIFLMFFGASPGSCGGGVKTTTLALLAAFTYNRLRHRRRVDRFKKSVPNETVTRSVSLVLVSIGVIGLVLFLILVGNALDGSPLNHSQGVFSPLFETVSAFGTVGLSMGVTPELSLWGQIMHHFDDARGPCRGVDVRLYHCRERRGQWCRACRRESDDRLT